MLLFYFSPNLSGRFFAVLLFMLDLIFFPEHKTEWDPFGCKLDSFSNGGGGSTRIFICSKNRKKFDTYRSTDQRVACHLLKCVCKKNYIEDSKLPSDNTFLHPKNLKSSTLHNGIWILNRKTRQSLKMEIAIVIYSSNSQHVFPQLKNGSRIIQQCTSSLGKKFSPF